MVAMKLFLLIPLVLWSFSSTAALPPQLASRPHELVCETLLALRAKSTSGVRPRFLDELVRAGLVKRLSPAGVRRLENEISRWYQINHEERKLKEERAKLDRELVKRQARQDSEWRYYWTLSWAGTGVHGRDVRRLDAARRRQQQVKDRLSQIEDEAGRYRLLMRDAEDRFQSSPGQYLNLTDEGRRMAEGLKALRGAFPQKSIGDLEDLLVNMDRALFAYRILQSAQALDRLALPAYLAAHLFANVDVSDLEQAHNEFREYFNIQSLDEPSLLLTSFQFQKSPSEVARFYEEMQSNNFVRANGLAAPLVAVGYRHGQNPEQIVELLHHLHDLVTLPKIPREMLPGLISTSLSANRDLSETLLEARLLMGEIGEVYYRQIPNLLLATWKSGQSIKEVGNLVREFRKENVSLETDAADLSTLKLNSGLEKADLMAIYRHLRNQSLESKHHVAPLTAIVVGRAFGEAKSSPHLTDSIFGVFEPITIGADANGESHNGN